MMFKCTVIASLVASAAAASFIPNGDIVADSKAGNKLMSKARALENDGDGDQTWMVDYSIKYLGCTSVLQMNGNGEGGGGDEENGSGLYTQNSVKFALCSNDVSCSSCGNGAAQYVVSMMDFVDAWTESKMEDQERACENVRENCYCDNANDDEACEAACYTQMGMDYCVEYEEDGDGFEVQRYLECSELEGGDNDNNNNNNNNNGNYNNANSYSNSGVDMYRQYYMGPTCASNGHTINLAVFFDSGCSSKAGSGVYEAFNYGASLPYEKESLVKRSECMSCKQVNDDDNNDNNNNNNNNNYNDQYNDQYNGNYYWEDAEVSEICSETYDRAAKCETKLVTGSAYFYADTSGCDYINNILPRLAQASSSSFSVVGAAGSGSASVAFSVIFFLTSCILGAYSFFLYRKIHRAKVNLAQSEGMTMA